MDQFSQASPEVFPLVLSFSLTGLAFGFVLWLVVTKQCLPRQRQQQQEKQDEEKEEQDDNEQDNEQEEGVSSKLKPPASWIAHDVPEAARPLTQNDSLDDNDNSDLPPLLSWSQVTCSYPSKTQAPEDAFCSLSHSFGQVRAGEVAAIMGGSGSGKSTLLDILSGRKTLGNLQGQVSVLGHVYSDLRELSKKPSSALHTVSAYVPQQENFFPTQTAVEAVAFAANMKLGKDPRGDAARNKNIQQVLRKVGLSASTCNRPIGGELAGGIVIRGLSGGERKRLTLACALALKPRFLFLDEITSGLDSDNAMAVTRLLKRICASNGVAALVVVHQPSGALFREFDRLVMLQKGTTVYSGETASLSNLYEGVFQATMPEFYDLPSDVVTRAANLSPEMLQQVSDESKSATTNSTLEETEQEKQSREEQPSAWWKFGIIFERNLTNHYIRNLTNLACRLLLYGASSIVDGLLFWQVGNLDNVSGTELSLKIGSVVGALTYIILVSYLLPFAMIPVFVHDKKFFLAERALGLYSPWLYCLTQLILETWVIVLAASLETAVITPMCGFWNPALAKWETFFTLLCALMVSGLTGSALVLFNAIALPSQDLAFLVASGIVTMALALSGGFVPFPQMEDFVSWLQWISPCKYTLQALALSVFRGSIYEDFVTTSYGFDSPPNVSGNVGVLLTFFVFFAGGTMYALSRQRETR